MIHIKFRFNPELQVLETEPWGEILYQLAMVGQLNR